MTTIKLHECPLGVAFKEDTLGPFQTEMYERKILESINLHPDVGAWMVTVEVRVKVFRTCSDITKESANEVPK